MLMVILLLGLFFVSNVQPMFMISSLILIVLMYSYIIFSSMGGYWFSYALMMVMLSGVLVVFTYMVSLIPNESFESFNTIYMLIVVSFIIESCMIFVYEYKSSIFSLEMWESYFGVFNVFMVGFLLSIMLVVVWVSYVGWGAIRI